MDYEKIYQDFYSKYYHKADILTKRFFIKQKDKKKTFTDTFNHATYYLHNDFFYKHHFDDNRFLKQALYTFEKRGSIYESDPIQEIFANEIKTEFEEFDVTKFPKHYNYRKLIKEIAVIHVTKEITRLLTVNSRILEMMYKLNEFDDFEIRKYNDSEDELIFERLHRKLYPHNYVENGELNNPNISSNENAFPLLFVNAVIYDCFLKYQQYIIDYYIDYSYLKKRLEKERLIHYHKDNDFMKIVFVEMKLIPEKNYNDYCIHGKLKSLAKSYSVQRENNFNIVFGELL